jgi:hypothetical protein
MGSQAVGTSAWSQSSFKALKRWLDILIHSLELFASSIPSNVQYSILASYRPMAIQRTFLHDFLRTKPQRLGEGTD